MTEQTPLFETAADDGAAAKRNPFEIGLGGGGAVAFVGGIILSGVGENIYANDTLVAELANSMSDSFYASADQWGMQLATFGNQLSTVGVAVLIGLVFYAMNRWNKRHQA